MRQNCILLLRHHIDICYQVGISIPARITFYIQIGCVARIDSKRTKAATATIKSKTEIIFKI
jgi:hypothetical protein